MAASLSTAGCAYKVFLKDEKLVRKNHYSIGLPPKEWEGGMRKNFYRSNGYYTDEQALFVHCPHHQGLVLGDVYMPHTPPVSHMKRYLPPEVTPDSFEGLSLSIILKQIRSLQIRQDQLHAMHSSHGRLTRFQELPFSMQSIETKQLLWPHAR